MVVTVKTLEDAMAQNHAALDAMVKGDCSGYVAMTTELTPPHLVCIDCIPEPVTPTWETGTPTEEVTPPSDPRHLIDPTEIFETPPV